MTACSHPSLRHCPGRLFHAWRVCLAGSLLVLGISPVWTVAGQLDSVLARAEEGDVDAQMRLGVIYRDGRGVERNPREAVRWFTRAVASGRPAAFDHLGWMYRMGLGVPRDYGEARWWFAMAARQDFGQAQYNLGRLYADGLGVAQDYATAASWWRKAAAGGHAAALYELAVLQLYGRGLRRDPEAAFQACRKAAGAGHHEARLLLGWMFHQGLGTTRDPGRARDVWAGAYKQCPKQLRPTMFQWLELKAKKPIRGKFAFVALPYMHQGWNNCAPTAAAMAIGAAGAPVDPYDIKRRCRGSATGGGTDWSLLVQAIDSLGRKARIRTFTVDDDGFRQGLAALIDRLDRSEPVLIDIRESKTPGISAHTVVAAGYDAAGRQLILQDPAIGLPGIRFVSYERLKQIWHSRGYTRSAAKVARPMIVID